MLAPVFLIFMFARKNISVCIRDLRDVARGVIVIKACVCRILKGRYAIKISVAKMLVIKQLDLNAVNYAQTENGHRRSGDREMV